MSISAKLFRFAFFAVLIFCFGIFLGKNIKGSQRLSDNVKVFVFAPVDHADKIRAAMESVGVGQIGNYADCTFTSSVGEGRYMPLEGAKPTIGKVGELVKVPEVIIQTRISEKDISKLIQAVQQAHPYETPGIDIQPLLEF